MDFLKAIESIAKSNAARPIHISKHSVLNYGDLWERSGRLACWLEANLPSREPVVVLGTKSHNMLIAFVACSRSGRAYVPVDEVMPNDRIKQIIDAARPKLMINTSEARDTGDLVESAQIISANELRKIFDDPKLGAPPPESALKPADILYILFTSGSTGMPKGVQITKSNLEDFIDWTIPAYGYLREPMLFLNQAPFSFDLSVYELYNSLATGGAFLSLAYDEIKEPRTMFEVIYRYSEKMDVWVSTPSFLGLCALDEGFDQNRFPKLKQFVLIGEVLPKPLARDILKRFPKTTLSNFYGPTEATVATTVYDVTLDSLDKYPTIPIGKSKPRSKILIEEGEIVIVGPNVSPGYVNDDERTNQVFVKRDGIQAYKTGDLGFFNEEGLLFYERRKDLQIKMNGYRIELGEIEAHLLELPDVKNCCVIPKISEGKVQRLCAFIILRSEDRIVTEVELKKRIRNSLMERLPAYMVPRQFVLVDVFPMNANGKADRRRLEEMA